MSNLTIRFFSNSLLRYATFQMIIPNDIRGIPREDNEYSRRKTKTLFLLHGYTGDAENWIPEYLCEKYNFAVVIPSGENSFWLDGISTGHRFCSFLGKDLLNYVRNTFGLAESRDETYIMGLSMGGFGALHTALFYPEDFGKAAGLSSALIVHEVAEMKEGSCNNVANYEYYRECFGEPSKVLESVNNPEYLAKKIKREGKPMPEIFMACGTEDFLLENNRQMHRFLEAENIAHTYEESSGNHDMEFWHKYTEKFIPMMFV